MDHPIPDLETEYGIRPRSIIKSKYFYIITAGGQLYRLYPFAQGAEASERLYSLNAAVRRDGVAACKMLKTREGAVLSVFEEQPFILTAVPRGYEPEPEGEDFLKTVSLAADFHRVLRGFEPEEELTGLPYSRGVQTLKHIRGIINRKNKLSEIDKLFNENYDMMYTLAENAARTLSDCGLGCTYCYGSPKEENFIITRSGEAFLTNWTGIRVSHFLADLAYMIRRYEKKSKEHSLPREKIISRYTAANPLSANEITALEGILSYPEKYILILKEYYGRHRPFAPLYVKEKLAKEINAAKEAFVKK